MGENILGYLNIDVIRKDAGSPSVSYVFSNVSQSVMIDNLGSPGVYVGFDSNSVPGTGSTSLFVPHNQARILDARVGSVHVYAPTGSPSVQVVGVRD